MFKKTCNLTTISSDRNIWGELQDNEAIQVLHRGHDPKVVISQEYFFHLLTAARAIFSEEFESSVAPQTKEQRRSAAENFFNQTLDVEQCDALEAVAVRKVRAN